VDRGDQPRFSAAYTLRQTWSCAAGSESSRSAGRQRHLQASFDALLANQLLPSAERANTNFLRPYRGYSSIRQPRSDAFSDYDGLQLYVNKRAGT